MEFCYQDIAGLDFDCLAGHLVTSKLLLTTTYLQMLGLYPYILKYFSVVESSYYSIY